MGSILLNNPLPPVNPQQQTQMTQGMTEGLTQMANNIIPQIMGSVNKEAVFTQFVNSMPGGQDALKKVMECGGDPHKALMNQMVAQGRQGLTQQIENCVSGLLNKFKFY